MLIGEFSHKQAASARGSALSAGAHLWSRTAAPGKRPLVQPGTVPMEHLVPPTVPPGSASEEYLRTIVEDMNEGFMAVDGAERVTLFNRRLEQITGCGRDQILGGHLARLFTAASLARVEAELRRRRQGESSSYEAQLRRADGSTVRVRVSGSPLRDSAGAYAGSFAVINDITEEVQAAREPK